MRLGLTNLAWDPSRDEAVAGLLARLGVDAIDVAPSKYFADVAAVGVEGERLVPTRRE